MASGYYDGTGLADAIAPAMNNLGKAMFGDPTINANNAYKNQVLQMQRQKLDLENQELAMKSPLYAAQREAALANAANSNASAKQTTGETTAASELANVLSSGIIVNQDGSTSLDPQKIASAAAFAVAANPRGDTAKTIAQYLAISRQQLPNATEQDFRTAAAMLGQNVNNNSAFTTGQVNQLEDNEFRRRVAVQQTANQAKSFEPVVVPDGSTVFPMPEDRRFSNFSAQPPQMLPQVPANTANSPLANAITQAAPTYQAPQSQSAPYTDPNTGAIIVPDSKSNAAFGTDNARLKLIDEADASANLKRGTAETAKFLSQAGITEKIVNPVGGTPGIQSAYDVMQQNFGDPETAFARNMWKELRTMEWLNKSSALKGAISDAENRELQSSFPSDGASAESRRLYLNKVAYVSDRGAFIESARAQALRDGQIPPDPAILRQQFDQQSGSKNPFALQQTQIQQPQSLADTVAGAGAPAASRSAIDPDIVKAMEIIARDPREKPRVNQMLINAGKPPIP